jgi:hypothetical protein
VEASLASNRVLHKLLNKGKDATESADVREYA